MIKMFRNSRVWLAALAVLLVACVSVGGALAYFTANTSASGGLNITLGPETTIHETFGQWTKTITVENTGYVEVYVRARAFAGDDYKLTCTGDGWTEGTDGWVYYSEIVPVGGTTSALNVKIEMADGSAVTAENSGAFNVVVVQECSAVKYDAAGSPSAADW